MSIFIVKVFMFLIQLEEQQVREQRLGPLNH